MGVVTADTNAGFQPFGFAVASTTLTRNWSTSEPATMTPRSAAGPPRIRPAIAGGDTNLYGYVGDNPLNRVDPAGLGMQLPNPAGTAQGIVGAALDVARGLRPLQHQ